jgi:hypothetical protein
LVKLVRLLHQGAGRAGLDAFPAGDAGRIPHRVIEIEHDLLAGPAQRHADHVVDLHLAAGPDAEVAMDAGIKLHGHGRMAEVVHLVLAGDRREAARRDVDPVGPPPERGIGVVRGFARGLIGDQQLEHQAARRHRPVGRGLHRHAG